MQALKALKGLLWFIAVSQFVIGALLLLTPSLAQLVLDLHGSSYQVTEQFTFILKPLGAYMMMTGLISSAAARADVPHPAIITALVLLFTINALYRIARFDYMQTTFGIAPWYLFGQVMVLSGLAIGLFALSRAAMKASSRR